MLKSLPTTSWKLIIVISTIFSLSGLILILFNSAGKTQLFPAFFIVIGFLLSLLSVYRLQREVEVSENISIEIAKELFWQSNHDSETGILNQKAISLEIERRVIKANGKSFEHGVLRADVDNFIVVKKSFGSEAALSLKQQVASILETQVESPNIMGVTGDRGFVIFLPDITAAKVREFINTIQSVFSQEVFIWQDKQLPISVSIGWTTLNESSEHPTNAINFAEIACIRASQNMNGSMEQYTPPKSRDLNEVEVVAQINHALKNDEFILYHQRLFFLGSDEEAANSPHQSMSEVLIRMKIEGSDIPMAPGLFIPIAENFNLMGSIDRWVINKTLEFIASNKHNKRARGHMYAINLSGDSLNDTLIFDFISNALDEYKVPPQQICFEVTESVAIKNLHHAAYLIGFLKRLGCQVALDDFGTGVSSFEYLKYLPIDKLKLDGSFVKFLANDKVDYDIVSAISNICQTLDIELVAEFVEKKETLSKLRELNIQYAQGYLLHKPSPLMGEHVFADDLKASAILKQH